MNVTSYYNVMGELLGERTGADSRSDYLRDALGSVCGISDSSGAVTNTYRYKPYGSELSKTGPGANPSFLWVGIAGYRADGLNHANFYVRARHYGREEARWSSVDPLWPMEAPYGYSVGNPTTWIDPLGLKECLCCCCADNVFVTPTPFRFDSAPSFVGHTFDIYYQYNINPHERAEENKGCQLEWYEMTNDPYSPLSDLGWQGQWSDLFGSYYSLVKDYAQFSGWVGRPQECGHSYTVLGTDDPGYKNVALNTSLYRRLCFRVILRSDPGCQCEKDYAEWTARQDILILFGETRILQLVYPADC